MVLKRMQSRSIATSGRFQAGHAPPNKGREFKIEVLTSKEAERLIRQCSHRAPTGIRNRALLFVLYRGGLRISEALALKPSDIDQATGGGVVRVLSGKGGKSRTVGIDSGALAAVGRWSDRRRSLGIRSRYLFCTLQGGPLDASYIRHLLKRLAVEAGIDKRVHPHGLRHTLAAELAMEGAPMHMIQALLGHDNLAVTNRYIAHLMPADVIAVMQKRPPIDA